MGRKLARYARPAASGGRCGNCGHPAPVYRTMPPSRGMVVRYLRCPICGWRGKAVTLVRGGMETGEKQPSPSG